MKVKDLIGKVILDIKSEITNYEYDGSIPLEHSDSVIILETGELIQIPFKFDIRLNDEIQIIKSISDSHKSLFNRNENNNIKDKNKDNIVNKVITGILIQEEDSSPELDQCVLEIDNNYLISEITMAPYGTGHTGIWIFTSKNDLYKKFGNNFIKLEN